MSKAITLGILAPGDMGSGVGQAMLAEGHRTVTALKGRSAHTQQLADAAGIEDLGTLEEVVAAADVILSILPPDRAIALAKSVAAEMHRTGARPVYVDCNAISPMTMASVAEALAETGCTVIDCGVIGLNPIKSPPTRFFVSGPDVSAIDALDCPTLSIRPIGDEIGKASALKMVYAAGTKGVWTLQTALLLTAARQGVLEPLLQELDYSQGAQLAAMRGRVPFLPADSARWVPEMQEIAATFKASGVTSGFHDGAADVFALLAKTPFAEETRATLDRSRTLEQALEEYLKHF